MISYFCIPVPYSDQGHQTATAQEWRRRGASPRPRSGAAAEKSYRKSEVRGGGREELPHPGGQGPGPRGTSPPPRSSCCGSTGGTIVWAQVNKREGKQPYPSTGNCIEDLLSMDPPIRTKPNFPLSQSLPSGGLRRLPHTYYPSPSECRQENKTKQNNTHTHTQKTKTQGEKKNHRNLAKLITWARV